MAEKKKILYIVEAMGGGVFTYIVDLANELVNKYDMYIAYIGHLFKHFNAARIAAITLPSDDRSFVDSQVALRIPISIGTSKNNRKRQEES